jgi:uncharacterized protein (TIGR02596 family)
VVAIVSVVAAFAVPAMITMLRGTQLTQGAQLISNQIDLARQISLSRDHSVEVRFYQYCDPSMPGQLSGTGSAGYCQAMQIFDVPDSGATVALDKVQTLPPSVIIDSGATLSSLIGSATATGVPESTTGVALKVPIPKVSLNYNCVLFRFLPDGSTNLPATSSSWFLTLHNLTAGNGLASPPPDFFTIQIDPTNGHIKNFRP